MEDEMKFRDFVIRGRVYGPNPSVAKHNVFWAIRNSEYDEVILIDELEVESNGVS